MSFHFNITKRYNVDLAREGVDYTSEDGFGTFKLKLVDDFSKQTVVDYKRLRAKNPAAAKDAEREDGDPYPWFVVQIVELSLIDWSGIEDNKGKPVPFSKEAAYSYLNLEDCRKTVMEILNFCKTPANYKREDAAEIEKN